MLKLTEHSRCRQSAHWFVEHDEEPLLWRKNFVVRVIFILTQTSLSKSLDIGLGKSSPNSYNLDASSKNWCYYKLDGIKVQFFQNNCNKCCNIQW